MACATYSVGVTDPSPPSPTPAAAPFDPRAAARWVRRRGLNVLLGDLPGLGRSPAAHIPGALMLVLAAVLGIGVPLYGWPWMPPLLYAAGAVLVAAVAALAAQRFPGWRGWWPVALVAAVVFVAAPCVLVLNVAPRPIADIDGTLFVPGGTDSILAVWLVATQLVALVVIVLCVYWDVISLTRWLVREITHSMSSAGTALTRVVPLLMVALLLAFFTAELWQSMGKMGNLPFTLLLALFVLLALGFLARREHFDVDAAAHFESRSALADALHGTPAAGAADRIDPPVVCPLTPRMERGLLIAASTSRLVLASLIGVCVFGFFLVVGWLTVDAATVKAWSGSAPRRLITFAGSGGHTYVLSVEHLRVAGFLAAFSGFYYAVASATDGSMRQGLRDTADDSIRSAVALRLALLSRMGMAPAHEAAGDNADQADPPAPAEPPPWSP